jgi:hypothetical protein
MRGLIYGLGAVVALAIAAPAVAGDLTSIELDSSGKAIAVKKEPGKLALNSGHCRQAEQGFRVCGNLSSAAEQH